MQFGAMNFPIRPVLDELHVIAEQGFDYVELTLDAPEADYRKIRALGSRLEEALSAYGLGLVCHMPTFVYPADLTESIREASRQEMIASLETAAQMKAMKVVLHPSPFSGLGSFVPHLAGEYAMESLVKIIGQAEVLGMTLCLENMFPRYRHFVEPDHFEPVFSQFPELRMTLDTGHANIGCPDGRRVLNFIRRYGERISHLHLSDNFGKRDDHLAPGDGSIDFVSIARELKKLQYDGTVTLEVFSEDLEDRVKARMFWSKLMEAD